MSCRLPPVPPKFQRYHSVSLFLILGFDLRPFEGANQVKKKHCNWGCGGLLDYKGLSLNNSSIYGRTRTDKNHRKEGSPAKLHLYESDRTNRTLAAGQDDLQTPSSWD